jgi:two-component system phosphate regulon sensor histidine kinase PhoR
MIQAFSNLIDNAVKYGEENHPVLIKSEIMEENRIKVSVTNTGEGIAEYSLGKIFERFYRVETSRSRKTGGVGLGLSVVKAICDWHNTEIKVESVPGKETRFSITLEIV